MKSSIFKSAAVAWLGVVWLCVTLFVLSAERSNAQPCGTNSIKVVKTNLTPCFWTPSGPDPYIGVEIVMYRDGGVNQRQWISPNDGANSVEYINNSGGPWNGQIWVEGTVLTIPAAGAGAIPYCAGINAASGCITGGCTGFSPGPYCPCLKICIETIGTCTTITLTEVPGPCSPCPGCP